MSCQECMDTGCRCGGIGLNCEGCCPCNAKHCDRVVPNFCCPSSIGGGDDDICGCRTIEELVQCDGVTSKVLQLHTNGEIAEYGIPILEGDIHTARYQCGDCGFLIANSAIELFEYLKDHNELSWISTNEK